MSRSPSQTVRLKLEAAENWQNLIQFLLNEAGSFRISIFDSETRQRLNIEKFPDNILVFSFTKRKPKHFDTPGERRATRTHLPSPKETDDG